MGVTHKLKPEVLNFILENKQNNPAISCRHLTSLIFEQLHIKVSKSSVNAVFKENALSMPIGRRRKDKKKKFKMPVLPVIEEKKSRLGQLPQEIEQAGLEKEKAKEETRLKELEKKAREAENQHKQEEARRLVEEKAAQEVAETKRKQEEALKLEQEKAAREAEEKRIQEEARAKEIEEAKQRELAKAEEEKRRIEELARKLAEEKAAQELARIKAEEEARLKELERLAQEAAETKRKQEEALRLEQERVAQEEIRLKALEEAKLRELEKAVRDAEAKRKQEEEARRLVEEKAAQEVAETKRKQEEALKLEQEKVAREAEEKKKQEEARIKELERLAQVAAEASRIEQEKAAREAELKAEREKWARIAEEEAKAKQPVLPEEKEPAAAVAQPELPEILPEERVCSGAMVLRTLDDLIGGSREISDVISRATAKVTPDSLLMTQALILRTLFAKDTYSTLGDLIGVRYSQERLNNYYSQIKQLDQIGNDTAKVISRVFTEAKGIKLHFTDGEIIHLDGQLYSTWPAARFPYDFSNLAAELKRQLEKNFIAGSPLVLFSPPGYDIFPKDFFSLLLKFGSKDNRPDSLTLFGNQLEELDTLAIDQRSTYSLIFGLWPWQFTSSRRVRRIGDFYLKYIKEIDRDLYLGEIEIDLFRASLNQSITLKGCAVKTDLKEKIRLVILNSSPSFSMDELAGTYLGRWPNFEEAFQDFSRKIELFTYAGGEQAFFPKNSFGLDDAGMTMDLAGILQNYVKMLDAYLRWHFLPNEYREKDLSSTGEYFYKIPAKLIGSPARLRIKTLVSQDYQYLRDLEYLNCRLNERQIINASGKRLWFESAFK